VAEVEVITLEQVLLEEQVEAEVDQEVDVKMEQLIQVEVEEQEVNHH
jgi:hypothetical protein